MSVSWDALTEDIRSAAPGSHLFYELIREAHRYVENKWSRVPALRPDGQAEGPGPAPGFEPGSKHIITTRDKEVTSMAKGPKGGSGAHGKAGGADKGKSDIDRTGKFGKHHGGNLSGSSKGGKGGGKK